MALERGTKLGPYQIDSPIGAGGMGEARFKMNGVLCLIAILGGLMSGVNVATQQAVENPTAQDIIIAAGSEADARAIISGALSALALSAFLSEPRARTVAVLRSQMRLEWLPVTDDSEFVRATAEAPKPGRFQPTPP